MTRVRISPLPAAGEWFWEWTSRGWRRRPWPPEVGQGTLEEATPRPTQLVLLRRRPASPGRRQVHTQSRGSRAPGAGLASGRPHPAASPSLRESDTRGRAQQPAAMSSPGGSGKHARVGPFGDTGAGKDCPGLPATVVPPWTRQLAMWWARADEAWPRPHSSALCSRVYGVKEQNTRAHSVFGGIIVLFPPEEVEGLNEGAVLWSVT